MIESFRNKIWPGYKDGSRIDPILLSQFPLVEEALEAAGFVVWPMMEHEADDGMASGAMMAAADERVEQVLICTPDKDLAQCVDGNRVVQFDRRQRILRNEAGVIDKFGVGPDAIPDWLALVGDTADGFPGIKGFGAKTAAVLLSHYDRIENIPSDSSEWAVPVRNAGRLATRLAEHIEDALLFRRLATLTTDAPVSTSVEELEWTGPHSGFPLVAQVLDAVDLSHQADQLASTLES